MVRRQPIPTLWLMTDERQGDGVLDAVRRLPSGSGIVLRHHATPPAARRALFDAVRRIARARRLVLLLAGPPALARAWRADGVHGPRGGAGLQSAPAHDPAELRRAERAGADLLFVSPVHATRSHPGARPLGRVRFLLLARQARRPVIALGGMDARRARALAGIHGWAAIDALAAPDQKRKAVPR